MPNAPAFLHKEPLSRTVAAPQQQQRSPRLSLVSASPEELTRKEQEACNMATD